MINIKINGQEQQFSENINLRILLEQCSLYHPYAAVAVNQTFIHKHLYATTLINEGDCVEILVPMQGG